MNNRYLYTVKSPRNYFEPVTLEKHKVVFEDDKCYKLADYIQVTESFYSNKIDKSFFDNKRFGNTTSSIIVFLERGVDARLVLNENEAIEIAERERKLHIRRGKERIRNFRKAIKDMEEHPFTMEAEGDNDEK